MDMTPFKIARWHMRRWAGQLTWSWMAAGAVLAFCTGFYLSVVHPARSNVDALQSRLLALQEEVRATEHADAKLTQLATPRQLVAFYKYFPPERNIPDLIEKISGVAARNKLVLRQAEYQVVSDKAGKLLMYQITLPVKGAYPNLRGFIENVLSEIPVASLDNVKFERQKIGDEALVSTVQLTLHLGRES